MKINTNAFKLGYGGVNIDDLALGPNESREVKLELNQENGETELEEFPYFIDCALKVYDDVFVFRVPCSLSIAMKPGYQSSENEYKEIISDGQNVKKQ